jgi:phosphoribosylformimino-5-aminoimidazole carboxamide ribotide isomerase
VEIIPVLDLMAGLVVRGVTGRRSEYRPIESSLARDARPGTVARAFAGLGLARLYVADLDAIAGADPAWGIYQELAATGLQLWIDAGTGHRERAESMRQFAARTPSVDGIVVGLESLAGPQSLAEVVRSVGQALAIFSLDLKAGQPLAAEGWEPMPPDEIVARAVDCGIERTIVLDLAQVGSDQGVGTVELCRRLAARHPELELIAGGGVRGPADLDLLAAAGCTAALVATALHEGKMGPTPGEYGAR